MTVRHETTITCDHPGCTATITGHDPAATSERARREGWATTGTDHCPEHKEDQP